MSKPTFKANIKLLLLTFPVKAFSAIESKNSGITFKQLCNCHNQPIQQACKCRVSGTEIDRASILKGYEHAKGQFLAVDQAELDALHPDSSRVLDIVKTVPASAVSPLYYDSVYYLAPDGPVADESFATLLQSLRGKMAIGTMQVYQRDRLAGITVEDNTMVLHLLRSAAEVRGAETLNLPEVKPAMTQLASQLIDTMMDDAFRPEEMEFVDTYKRDVVNLIQSKLTGVTIQLPAAKPQPQSSGLLEALQASLDTANRAKADSLAKAAVAAPQAAKEPVAEKVKKGKKKAVA
jgi:DNA end-binding protein Ku